ncbi:MAG: hypothetical protein ACJATT_002646 [Myxococcota bacterium]
MKLHIKCDWSGQPLPRKEHVEVSLKRVPGGAEIAIRAPFYGDPPPNSSPGPTNSLWEFEVVEVFIAGPGSPIPYTEIEVGPAGHHLVLTLHGVRQPTASGLPLHVDAHVDEHTWYATATITDELLPPRPWRVNATAIHGLGTNRAYASTAVLPGDAPDFHQPDVFLPFST